MQIPTHVPFIPQAVGINMKYLVFIGALFFFSDAKACSCPENFDIGIKDSKAHYVFIGALNSQNKFRSFSKNKYEFNVSQMFKGMTQAVEAWSYKSSASCGVKLETGRTYLVFAFRDGTGFWIDSCSIWEVNDANSYYLNSVRDFYASGDGPKGLE